MYRARLARLENVIAPAPPRIRAALAWRGEVRELLIGAVNQGAPEGIRVADLPPGCVVFESNPREEAAALFLDIDGEPYCHRILGVDEDVVLGRDLPPKRPEGGCR
jgi:hypothetical protein